MQEKCDMAKVLETYINDLKASKNNLSDFDEVFFYALVLVETHLKVNRL
jgi:hypothetical protein